MSLRVFAAVLLLAFASTIDASVVVRHSSTQFHLSHWSMPRSWIPALPSWVVPKMNSLLLKVRQTEKKVQNCFSEWKVLFKQNASKNRFRKDPWMAMATKQEALQAEREQNKVAALERMQSHLGDQIFIQNEQNIMS